MAVDNRGVRGGAGPGVVAASAGAACGEWMASLVVGGGRWQAGQAMMRNADPAAWNRMARLVNACPKDTSTDLCEAAMAVRQAPASGVSEGAKTLGSVPASPHGKAGRLNRSAIRKVLQTI